MFSKALSVRLGSRLGIAVLLLALLAVPLLSALPAQAQSGWEVVASGLNNPRGLAFGPEGALYVAEAGTGGSDCYNPDPGDPTFVICAGMTGSITRIYRGAQTRLNSMASLAGPEGFGAIGPVDISFQGRGGSFVMVGLGADPAVRDFLAQNFNPIFANFGHLAQMPASGKWKNIVDVAAYEGMANPDGGEVDSNPYAVFALPNKRIVADAGGNDLLQVNANGNISTLAVFPEQMGFAPPELGLPPGTQIPVQAVPDSVVVGPDGAYYVGQLASISVDSAKIFRIPAGGGTPEIYADGFTAIIDFAFAPDGSLYVLEIFKNGLLAGEFGGDLTGSLIHVALDGTQTEIASEGLFAPGGLTVGPDGMLYVSNFSIFPGMGQVVKIDPAGASATLKASPRMQAQPKGKGVLFGVDLNRLRGLVFDQKVFLPDIER